MAEAVLPPPPPPVRPPLTFVGIMNVVTNLGFLLLAGYLSVTRRGWPSWSQTDCIHEQLCQLHHQVRAGTSDEHGIKVISMVMPFAAHNVSVLLNEERGSILRVLDSLDALIESPHTTPAYKEDLSEIYDSTAHLLHIREVYSNVTTQWLSILSGVVRKHMVTSPTESVSGKGDL